MTARICLYRGSAAVMMSALLAGSAWMKPPVDGAANKVLIGFVAEVCGVPRSAVVLESGASGRIKRLAVEGVGDDMLLARLISSTGGA